MNPDPIEITEAERALRRTQPVNLQSEIWHLMRRHAREMQTAREETGRRRADEHNQRRKLVTDLARAHHQLKVFLDRQATALEQAGLGEQAGLLGTIRDRYEQVLTRAGAQLIYLDGQPFTYEATEQVTVTAWIPGEDVDQLLVRETVSPGVLLDGELICPAEVEVATPAPPPAMPPAMPTALPPVAKPQEVTDEPSDRD